MMKTYLTHQNQKEWEFNRLQSYLIVFKLSVSDTWFGPCKPQPVILNTNANFVRPCCMQRQAFNSKFLNDKFDTKSVPRGAFDKVQYRGTDLLEKGEVPTL